MKLTLPIVVMLSAGTLLLYSAINNIDPRDVFLSILGKEWKYGKITDPGTQGFLRNLPPNGLNGGGGGSAPSFTGYSQIGNIRIPDGYPLPNTHGITGV